ncbi:hypothetical protein ACFYVL_44305 [Streptomyces sp. NPDC004111]|uniref:hypothetical protein n=1 Tax=Streptomyces sp. NPDC004111 TaxID=3364690 RepID=UPI0036B52D33
MSAVREARSVLTGASAAMTALWRGSVVLTRRACTHTLGALSWAWTQASIDPVAQAAAEAEAKKARKAHARAVAKAAKAGEEPPEFDTSALPSGRRPPLEALAFAAFGAALVAGAVGTVCAVAAPYVGLLAPWRPVIISVGGLAWVVAAWVAAPPPDPADEEDQEQDDDGQQQDQEEASAEAAAHRLMHHVLAALAAVEAAGGKGVHVAELVDTAVEAGLLAPGATKIELRDWVEKNGVPVTKSVKLSGTVDYGVRVDRVTEALGMTPADALAKLFPDPEFGPRPGPVGEGQPAPAEEASEEVGEGAPEPVGEIPAETPSEAPANPPPRGPSGVLSGALSRLSLPARLGALQTPPQ